MVPLIEATMDLNADCAEFCPVPGCQRQLAVGTYQLQEDVQERIGRLHVYTVQGQGDLSLEAHRSLDMAGIFDMRWLARTRDDPLMAVASSDSSVSLIADRGNILEAVAATQCLPESMAASIALQEGRGCGGPDRLATTGSGGEVAVLQMAGPSLRVESCWIGHSLEAWTCCFDHWNASTLYSGGDDCAFKAWDLRQEPSQPTVSNRREHGAGVCCIASSPLTEHLLVTGSYDEKMRQWDCRNLRSSVCQVSAGGGVWRLKFHPRNPQLLLAACMHNGFAVVRSGGSSGLAVVHDYAHQKTLGYGADWCHDDQLPVVATASFYDRLLHVWKLPEFPA